MTAALASVLLASLVGSLHCAGMCGPFLTAFAGDSSTPRSQRMLTHGTYHLARLGTYATLGALAGLAGSALDVAGSALGVRLAATLVAGALVVLWGAAALATALGVRVPLPRAPRGLSALFARTLSRLRSWPPPARAAAIGLATTLLPCGWLHAFTLAAAATGSPLHGAALMAAFWAGTLPALVAVGAGVLGLFGPLRRRAPVLAASAVVVLGLLTVARAVTPLLAPRGAVPACHDASLVP